MGLESRSDREWLRKLRTAVEDMGNPCFGSELHNQTVRDIENMLLVHVDEILASLSAERAPEAFSPEAAAELDAIEGRSMFKWWRDRFDDIADDAKVLLPQAPKELHGAIEGIRVVAEQGRDGMDRLFNAPASSERATNAALQEVEDALWTLHSYESNRDDAGRSYSEAEITKMVSAIRALAPNSATSPSNSTRARHIEGFRDLNANWDSYGAEKLTEQTIQLALRVSAMLGDEWKVIPCADGPSAWFFRGNEDEIIKVWASAEGRDA